MKNSNYVVKGAPVIASLCAILMSVLWYFYFYFYAGQWVAGMSSASFEGLDGTSIFVRIMALATPVVFFIAVLFLGELNVRWVLVPLFVSVGYQFTMFILYMLQDVPEYVFQSPFQFAVPFLTLILFALTAEKVIPNKLPMLIFCGIAVVVPLILTFCGVGEFVASYEGVRLYYWSDYIWYALYSLGIAGFVLKMRPPRPEDLVTMKDLKQAYAEKMAAKAAEEEHK